MNQNTQSEQTGTPCSKCGTLPSTNSHSLEGTVTFECDKCLEARRHPICPGCGTKFFDFYSRQQCDQCHYDAALGEFSKFLKTLSIEIGAIGGQLRRSCWRSGGDFEEIAAFKEPAVKAGEKMNSRAGMTLTLAAEKVQLSDACQESIRDFFFTILGQKCRGWEINAGSHGSFVVDITTQRIRHDHTVHVEESTSETYDMKEAD